MKPKGKPVLTRRLDKTTAEWLIDLLDTLNDPELSLEERAFAGLQAAAALSRR
jgi:hypothetical protein